MNHRKHASYLVLLCSILLMVGCGQKKAAWKGSIHQENGVVTITNPREPMYPGQVLMVKKELVIGGEETRGEGAFSSIGSSSSVEVDNEGNIFILSPRDAAVFVYDEHGSFIRKFGRPGQGPGELGPAQSIFISGETVMVNCLNRKICVFTRNGDFLRSLSTKEFTIYFAKCDRWGNIYGFELGWLEDQPAVRLVKFDREMNFIMEITHYPIPEPDKPLDPFARLPSWQMTPDGSLVFSRPEAYLLEFYTSDRRLVRKVRKAYSPVKITDEEKERHKRNFSGEVKFRLEYHPGFGRFICDDKGRLFVQTFEQSGDGSYIHDIFDEQGRFIARIPLKGTLQASKGDKLYCSDEDEKGFNILVRYGLRWNLK